ncbi:MAG TPA: hypothetical protein VFT59_01480 [Candidatus Saccharimonadales bacterium]|nr:hypothetical protein [Candidatus Saccharimonadales bacterium]
MTRKPGEDLQNPDYQGTTGRAWEVTGFGRDEIDVGHTASLGIWLIEAPMVNPLWSHYAATLFHLQDIPGAPPVKFRRQGATHEFWIGTVDPEVENTIDPSDIRTFKMLSPPDLQDQFILPSNARALEVVRLAIQQCVDGQLSPDAENHRQEWIDFFRSQEGR